MELTTRLVTQKPKLLSELCAIKHITYVFIALTLLDKPTKAILTPWQNQTRGNLSKNNRHQNKTVMNELAS